LSMGGMRPPPRSVASFIFLHDEKTNIEKAARVRMETDSCLFFTKKF